jgi:2-haloacid dehalogenase
LPTTPLSGSKPPSTASARRTTSKKLGSVAANVTRTEQDSVIEAFGRLPAHPDAAPALRRLSETGVTVVALTNGNADNTRRLLTDAHLDDHLQRVISVDEVGTWKPAPAPYLHTAAVLGHRPQDVALAHRAGLATGWCARLEGTYPAIFDPATVTGADLVAVADALLNLPV